MNDKKDEKTTNKRARKSWAHSAKECAYLAVFIALIIALQVVFSFVPGVELVTVMFVAYAFVMGAKRGVIAATGFSLLRQLVFGFYPKVLILYLIYFNLLTFVFGLMGRKTELRAKKVWLVTLVACIGTTCFTMLDNLLTPIWYGYNARLTWIYFYGSMPFMIPQVICTALSVAFLFLPLAYVFKGLKGRLG